MNRQRPRSHSVLCRAPLAKDRSITSKVARNGGSVAHDRHRRHKGTAFTGERPHQHVLSTNQIGQQNARPFRVLTELEDRQRSGSWAASRCITYQAATGCSPERSTGNKVVFSSMLSPSRVGTVNSAATRARRGLCHPHSTSVRDSPRSRLRSRAVDRSSVAQLRTTHS